MTDPKDENPHRRFDSDYRNFPDYLKDALRPKVSRPRLGILGIFTRRLPPAPVPHYRLDFKWSTLRERIRKWHVFTSLSMLVGVLIAVSIIYRLTFMRFSVLTFSMATISAFGYLIDGQSFWSGYTGFFTDNSWKDYVNIGFGLPWWLKLIWLVAIYLIGRYIFFDSLPGGAIREEQIFREGCENWTTSQKAKSCVLFGLAHLGNLIYPIGITLVLIIGGAIFMAVYLKHYNNHSDAQESAMEAATLHLTYNTIAFSLIGIYFVINILL